MTELSSADPAVRLDDLSWHERIDRSGMYTAILGFPDQLRRAVTLVNAVDWPAFRPTTPAGICICGMGGSAIGGDLARLLWEEESPIPIIIVRNYRIPAFVNEHWLIVASSYSGNTEETLAAVADASARRCRQVVAVTAGGQLGTLAGENRWPLVSLPPGLMPRAALGYSLGAFLMVLSQWGVVGNNPAEVTRRTSQLLSDTAAFLAQRAARWDRSVAFGRNPAKSTAAVIAQRTTVIWGAAGSTDTVARRFAGQLCENGKMLAVANTCTEAHHNEIVGLDRVHEGRDHLSLLALVSADDHPGIVRQRRAALNLLSGRGVPVAELEAEGANRLERMLSLVQFGDYLSYYVAILTGHDPTPIAAIGSLKAALTESS